MGDELEQDPQPQTQPGKGQLPNQDDIDKRLEDIKRTLTQGVTEPYTGRPLGKSQPLLPVWDYELPEVTGLKAPASRTRLEGLNEIVACTNCNGTGRALCPTCAGRGWYVCPDCRGRTKKRCSTCRGRGYVADWVQTEKKPF